MKVVVILPTYNEKGNIDRLIPILEKDIFPQLAQEGKLNVFLHKGYWIDCGTEERLTQAHNDFL